jgi:ribosomal protein S14
MQPKFKKNDKKNNKKNNKNNNNCEICGVKDAGFTGRDENKDK